MTNAEQADALAAVAERIAVQQVVGLKDHDGSPLDAWQWLSDLAGECMPWGAGAAALISHARGVDPSWDEAMFPEGYAGTVLSGPHEHLGGSMYAGYSSILDNTSASYRPPDAAECIGVDVPTSDFMVLDDDDDDGLPARMVPDRDAWMEEVERRCTEECEQFIEAWRRAFFAALLDGKQPSLRRPCEFAQPAPAARMEPALSDDDVERLLADIESATPEQRAESAAAFDRIPGMEQLLDELRAVLVASGVLNPPSSGP